MEARLGDSTAPHVLCRVRRGSFTFLYEIKQPTVADLQKLLGPTRSSSRPKNVSASEPKNVYTIAGGVPP